MLRPTWARSSWDRQRLNGRFWGRYFQTSISEKQTLASERHSTAPDPTATLDTPVGGVRYLIR